jgi:hypothetical protein
MRVKSLIRILALIAAGAALAAPADGAQSKPVKTKLFVLTFDCFPQPQFNDCNSQGIVSTKSKKCYDKRPVEMQYEGTTIATVKADDIGSYDFENGVAEWQGAGTYSIVVPKLTKGKTVCKAASESGEVNEDGQGGPGNE